MQYYVDWSSSRESIAGNADDENAILCNEIVSSMKSILIAEYSDAPQLLEFFAVIENALSESSQNCEDPTHLLEALDELLWAYTLK